MKPRGQQLNLDKLTLYNLKAPLLVQAQDIRVGKDNPFLAEIPANNVNSITPDLNVNVGISYICLLTTGGIFVDDQVFFTYFGLYNATSGNYTGDPIPATTYGFPMVHPTDGTFYYAPSAVGSDFYIFDVIAGTNTKKTMVGVSTVRRILHDSVNDKVIIVCLNGIAVYDVFLDSFVYYTNSSGNYTGPVLPTTGLIQADIKDDLLFMTRSADGLYKFDLTNAVNLKYTTADGLASNSPIGVAVYNNYAYIIQAIAATPLSRMLISSAAVTHFGNATANYAGDKIRLVNSTAVFTKPTAADGILQFRQSGSMSIVKIDFSTEALTVSNHMNAVGLKVSTTNFANANLMTAESIGADYLLGFTGTSIGVQQFTLAAVNPLKLQFSEFGLEYVSDAIIALSPQLLSANSVVYRDFVDTLTNALDLRIDQLEGGVKPTFTVLTDLMTISSIPSLSAVYYYSGATPITISVSLLTSISWFKITIVQLGAGSIQIGGILGTNSTKSQYDIVELFAGEFNQQFIGRLHPAPVGSPQVSNKNMTPTATVGDNQTSGLTLTVTPRGFIIVSVDGVNFRVGNGSKLEDCYFSSDSGVTAKTYANLAAGDTLYWNGVIAGADLAITNRVDFYYI